MVISKKLNNNILFVEDEIDILLTYAARLEMKGYEITPAYDGQEALLKAKQYKPDLILLDLVIPKMNGFEVCRSIRKSDIIKNTPVIIVTAFSDQISEQKAKACGANDFFIKPFDIDELVRSMSSLIIRR